LTISTAIRLASIGALSEDALDEGKEAARDLQEGCGSVAILDAGWMRRERKSTAVRVDEGVSLEALNLLASVIGPPLSVVFLAKSATCRSSDGYPGKKC
jgi:hypothetical protein